MSIAKLNFGCGGDNKEGYINVDWNPLVTPDVSHDLNVFPYPFKDNTFDEVEAIHALEHLEKPFRVMTELHRILKPGGRLHIKVPHFSRGFTHAEHNHGFDVTFPLYFNKSFVKHGYFGIEFKLTKMRLRWMAHPHLLPFLGYSPLTISLVKCADKIVSFFANLSPGFASRIWCYWVGGFDEVEFVFTPVK